MNRMTTAERQAQAEQRRAAILKEEERKRGARSAGVGAAAASGGGGGAGGRRSNQQRAVRDAIERGKQQRARQLAQQKRHDKNASDARSRRIAEVRVVELRNSPRSPSSLTTRSPLVAPPANQAPHVYLTAQMHNKHRQKEGLDERQAQQKSEDEKRLASINTAMSMM